jgi:hypothetical protein
VDVVVEYPAVNVFDVPLNVGVFGKKLLDVGTV